MELYERTINHPDYGISSAFEMKRKEIDIVRNPSFTQYTHCAEFTALSKLWRNGKIPGTPAKEIRDIEDVFKRMHPNTPNGCLDAIWSETESRFMANPGFAAYYARYCMHSEWYPRWPLNVPTARAVVGPFGWGWDLEGNFGQIPITDDHAWWTEHHPVMRYMRERGKNSAYLVAQQHKEMQLSGQLNQHRQRICVLSAGYIPWLTMLNYRADPETQEIIACDMDREVSFALYQDLGEQVPELTYYTCKNEEIFANPSFHGYFDIVLMDGGYVYYPPEYRELLLGAALNLLAPNGLFVYDNQCQHWAMEFAQELFAWGYDTPIYLAKNPWEIRSQLFQLLQGQPFSVDVYYDAVNDDPVGATIAIRRMVN